LKNLPFNSLGRLLIAFISLVYTKNIHKMILIIDNYDSFTFNLYHYVAQLDDSEIIIKRNDKITLKEIEDLKPQSIIISPGPCSPNEAGISLQLINKFFTTIPILGVCLGHQAIGQAFGGNIIKTHPMHGKISEIHHQQESIFRDIPSPFKATRYHSLIIDKATFPDDLKIIAITSDDIIMAIEHLKYPIYGVQFHPESIASEFGHKIIKNFLEIANNFNNH
jgi:anthranilate synthase/aminodeoxychorismate synthase-like glutamine amidotransferase